MAGAGGNASSSSGTVASPCSGGGGGGDGEPDLDDALLPPPWLERRDLGDADGLVLGGGDAREGLGL